MPASANACIVPGSTISSCGAPRSAVTTDTVGTASSRVSRVTTVSALARVEIPHSARPTAAIINSTPPISGPNDLRFDIRLLYCVPARGPATVQQRKHRRHEEQRRHGRQRQAADHGAAERRVLFAAF